MAYTYIALDVDAMMDGFASALGMELQRVANVMNDEMYSSTKIRSSSASPNEKFMKDSVLKDKGAYQTQNFTKHANELYIELIQNAYAILSSYGTGKSRDKNNPYWEAYTKSEYFNPARKGDAIVGRPSEPNPYTNIFGKDVKTSGALEGQEVKVPEYYPSYAIQKTETRWFGDSDDEVLSASCLFVKTLAEFAENWLNANMANYMNDGAIGGGS